MEKRRLGRGLDALLGLTEDLPGVEVPGRQTEVPLGLIENNPYQPRKSFDADALASLSASVRAHGILQPLVVRMVGERYQLIAGQRRLRAAQEAGLSAVPVRVVDFNDQEVLEAALVENIQRTDLNPIEKAQGFKQYLERFGMDYNHLAQRLGLSRSTISNLINLLELPAEIQDALRTNQISEGHAKMIKGVKDPERQIALFKQVVAQGLSVKETEQLCREEKGHSRNEAYAYDLPATSSTINGEGKTAHVKALEDELRQRLATPVEIRLRGKDKGQIIIRFESNDDFMRLLDVIRK
jgi:ParB family chromosome partitioning protein